MRKTLIAMDIYIYYTVFEQDATAARQRVATLQQRLAKAYDIAPQLKRQSEAQDGLQTWMEIYPEVPGGFGSVIEQAAVQEGIAELVQGTRHVEYFMDLSPCA